MFAPPHDPPGRFLGVSLVVASLVAPLGCRAVPLAPLEIVVLENTEGSSTDLRPVDWAVDSFNRVGGIADGRSLLVRRVSADGMEALQERVKEVIADDGVLGVIFPGSSADVFEVAPRFVRAKKVLVSPTSTSGEVLRAFGGSDYVWRTTESDIAQLEAMLLVALERGHQRVAMLTNFEAYGATFFDWFGFLASELGLTITGVERFNDTTEPGWCHSFVDELLGHRPETLLVVVNSTEEAECVARSAAGTDSDAELLFSDSAFHKDLLARLGSLANGLEIVTPAAAPETGFETAYMHEFGEATPPYAANLYDAVLLLGYGLEESQGEGGASLVAGMQRAVNGRGPPVGWSEHDVLRGLDLIREDGRPDLSGATGPLTYDPTVYTDLSASVYARWRVEFRKFILVETYGSGEGFVRASTGQAIVQAFATRRARQDIQHATVSLDLEPKQDLWVLIGALSRGWNNYRHQADALAQYQLFRARGIDDDHIILIGADDIADAPENKVPGIVRNDPGGPDVRRGAEFDYGLDNLSADDIMSILAGEVSERTPTVIESGRTTNVYVYLVGHGGADGLAVGAGGPEDATVGSHAFSLLTPDVLSRTVANMHESERYRRMLIMVEACHAGVVGKRLRSPGVLLLAAANPFENSLGFGYDRDLETWVADQFSRQLFKRIREEKSRSLYSLFNDLYLNVSGSHVSMYNASGYGDTRELSIDEFLIR